jgi:hypothetical protein
VPIDVELLYAINHENNLYCGQISRRPAVRKEDCRRGVGRGQQRCIDDSRPHE